MKGAPGGTPWRIGGEQRCERDRRGRRACPIEPSAVSGRSREQKDRSKSRTWEHEQGRGGGTGNLERLESYAQGTNGSHVRERRELFGCLGSDATFAEQSRLSWLGQMESERRKGGNVFKK